ncbi:ABC transporter permease [Gordonia sp. ABSL49_1]|uniref:ABC transporter permease n=1 Tax=unclassified Gordonia (in: high G+C Gram-positive bacteria) TaxID=2657482 RepID=UPI001F10EA6D|nr:ABC transporter permease [Gordonia sp. ABSL49_1]MCH5643096.1 ABC transporter permease [Gordonia sp. ABSL49_1]
MSHRAPDSTVATGIESVPDAQPTDIDAAHSATPGPDVAPLPPATRVRSTNVLTRSARLPRDLGRAVGSELAKLSWRSPLWYAIVPLAVLIPTAINFGIAKATQMEAIDGSGGMDTNNAGYWVIVFSTIIMMSAPVSSFSNEFKDRTVEIVCSIQPRRWLLPVAKLIVFGTISALVIAGTIFGILSVFPHVFPEIWGRVDLWSAAGLRQWVGTAYLSVLICALGLGLAVLLPRPGLVIMVILLWIWGIENFVGMIQGDIGLTLQNYSPFKNATLGVGQITSIESPFGGPNGSLVYFSIIAIAIFVFGLVRLASTDLKSE